jgi:hypothetical protein
VRSNIALTVLCGSWLLACNAAAPAPPAAPASGATSGADGASVRSAGTPFPIVRQQNYRIEQGDLALELDPTDGGRIIELSLGSGTSRGAAGDRHNALVTRGESPRSYGSSLWPSPQSDWKWPPPAELDALPWQVVIEGRALRATSGINPALALSAEQRIELLPEQRAVRIDYRLINHGGAPRKVAAWQNSRVRPRGLTFFPSNGASLPQSKFALAPSAGVIWFAHQGEAEARTGKLFADGEEGWLAHVDGDLLLVKVFPPVVAERQAPGEAEVEIYVDPGGAFVEVEQQGPYEEVAPGASLAWQCYWLLERLEPGLVVQPEQPWLIERARSLAARVR